MEYEGINIKWLGNAGFLIEEERIIYIDPYNIKEGLPKADVIFLTHSHQDHCSVGDIYKLIKPGTRIVMTADCQSKIMRFEVPIKIEVVEPGDELEFGGLKISCVSSYNIDKSFHPKQEHWIGYLIKLEGVLIYHAGDTDFIPEMQKLTGYKQADNKFVALLPVGGRFTMTAEEAVEAAKLIKPDLAIPMHYGAVAGSEEDAQEFKELCEEEGIKVEVLKKE